MFTGDPCLNNGHCIDGINKFTCDCNGTGYHGKFCETEIDDCAMSPCKNNGSCTDIGFTYTCSCNSGFSGVTCDEDINECDTEQHKCTAESVCLNHVGSYTCVCFEGYKGKLYYTTICLCPLLNIHTKEIVYMSCFDE